MLKIFTERRGHSRGEANTKNERITMGNENKKDDQPAAREASLSAPICSRSDTPETDGQTYWNSLPALATSAEIVHADLARKLERERDEARTLIRQIRDQVSEPWDVGDTVVIMCDQYFENAERSREG